MSIRPEARPPATRRLDDATCTACGLLCDDIAPVVAGDRIAEALRACDLGRSWFLADHRRDDLPPAAIDGAPATPAEAIERAAALLLGSRAPVVAGLTAATVESQAIAATLADRLGAAIGPAHAASAWPRVAALRRAGAVLASFGEVINRADVIILWGVDPSNSHPRLRERLIDRPGRFVPEGRAGRTVLVVDDGRSECRLWADDALAVPPGRHAEAIDALRAAVRGVGVDPNRLAGATGVSSDAWRRWADRLGAARYGAILFGDGLAREGAGAVESLMRLLDDLNRAGRCVAVPLAGPGNPAGAEAVLTGRLGAPTAVDLADGAPRHLPLDADPEARLRAGEADAVLVVGDPPDGFDDDRPEGVPVVLIGPAATARAGPGLVAIATATPGIDDGGTVFRSDEVPLPLRPALAPTRPSMREVLDALRRRCADGRGPTPPLPAG